jgi:hypothetical protein
MPSCLSIVQTICNRVGIPAPNQAVGSTDQQIINLVALLNEEGQELAARHQWVALQTEAHYTTVGVEDQGLMETIAPGLGYIINDTIWNRSLRRPVFGPKTPQGQQQQKAFAINGPWSNFWIKGNHLYMYPVPVAGQDCYFDYSTRYWLTDSTGATGREEFGNDADIPRLEWILLVLGTVWRWKKLKGFEYSEDFNTYERRVMDAMGKEGSRDFLSLSNTKYDIQPGIMVASGSWNVN